MNYQSTNPIVNNYDNNNNHNNRNNNNGNGKFKDPFERASFGEKLKIVDVKAFDGFTAVFVAFAFYALDDAQIGVSQYLYGNNTYQYVVHRYVYLGLVVFITCLINVWIINSKHYILKRKHKNHHHDINNNNNNNNNNDIKIDNNVQYYDIFSNNNNINEINKKKDDIIETAWDFLVDNYGLILIKSTWVGLIYSWNTTLAIQIVYLYSEGSLGYSIGMVLRFVILVVLFFIFVLWHIYSLKRNIKILF